MHCSRQWLSTALKKANYSLGEDAPLLDRAEQALNGILFGVPF